MDASKSKQAWTRFEFDAVNPFGDITRDVVARLLWNARKHRKNQYQPEVIRCKLGYRIGNLLLTHKGVIPATPNRQLRRRNNAI